MMEYYLIALTEPDIRAIRRILRILEKNNIIIENIFISFRINVKDPSVTGALGGLTNLNENIILLKGYIPLPRLPKQEF